MNHKFKIGRNDVCLCGSGAKYKKCCAPYIEESKNFSKLGFDAFKTGNFKEAERQYRAHLTQYLIWYNEHTAPFRKARPKEAEGLFSIDIEALAEIADSVAKALFHQKKLTEICNLYSHLSTLIQDLRYNFYMDSHHAYWLCYHEPTIKSQPLIDKYFDKDLSVIPLTDLGKQSLGMFVFLTYQRAPALKLLSILEYILKSKIEIFERLGYLTDKLRITYLHQDLTQAKNIALEIKEILSDKKTIELRKLGKLFALLPELYSMMAIVLRDSDYLIEEISVCKEAIEAEKEDKHYLASLHGSIARAYTELGTYPKAEKYLLKALELDKKNVYYLDLAKVYLRDKNQVSAIKTLKMINYDELEEGFKIDYLSYWTDIALTNADKRLAAETEKRLAGLKITIPYFKELAFGYRSLLLDFLSDKKPTSSLIKKCREFASKYLILQPNFFGLGINFNEIIKPSRPEKHTQKEP